MPKSKQNSPKAKKGKGVQEVVRPSISQSSLAFVPPDVLPGFQERLLLDVPWTLREASYRTHRRHMDETNPNNRLTDVLKRKLQNSFLKSFIDNSNHLTLNETKELFSLKLWDQRFCTDIELECFEMSNAISDVIKQILRDPSLLNEELDLEKALKSSKILRLLGGKMTELGQEISEYKELLLLNLGGNYLRRVDAHCLPSSLKMLELQGNFISDMYCFSQLSANVIYLGLARNCLADDTINLGTLRLSNIAVLDLSDNDICDPKPVLDAVSELLHLVSLALIGNPCSLSYAYSTTVQRTLPQLNFLDYCEVLPEDAPGPINEDVQLEYDLKMGFFLFTCHRVMSVPPPPKEKGKIAAFHLEMELPLLDSKRRLFLAHHDNKDLVEVLPDVDSTGNITKHLSTTKTLSKQTAGAKPAKKVTSGVTKGKNSEGTARPPSDARISLPHEIDIYQLVTPVDPRVHLHYTVFETPRVQWAKVMTFPGPAIKIFCPDLAALRDTFRSIVNVRLVFSLTGPMAKQKVAKKPKDGVGSPEVRPDELRVTVASFRCALRPPAWSRALVDYHWSAGLGGDEAVDWGDDDLAIIQYTSGKAEKPKGKKAKKDVDEEPTVSLKDSVPESLTCHVGFGVERLAV